MKKDLKEEVKRRFRKEKFSKIIIYKNPNEFSKVYIERVNPDHIGILWGRRRKELNKGTHYIRWGKVYFSILPVVTGLSVVGWLDAMTGYIYTLLLNVGILALLYATYISFMLWYIPLRLGDKINA